MKTKIWIGCTLLCGLLTTSCSDFLTEDAKGQLDPKNYYSSQEELDMNVYALYQKVMKTQGYTNMQLPQWMGDDMTANPGSNKQAAAEFDAFVPADNNKGVTECWQQHYVLIKAANKVIAFAAETPTTQEEINIAVGQAKYWRAYSYFTLVRVFGPLPLRLEPANSTDDIDYSAPVASVEDVYTQIVKDLKDAETILPTDYDKAPRKMFGANTYITRQAAKSTLAAVYMAMAGWPLKKTEYYAEAAAKAKEVIDGVDDYSYEYILEKNFKNVYAMSTNYTNETVVGINYVADYGWDQDSQLTSSNLFESLGGWGDAFGEIRFWKDMPAGPRKDAIYNPKILLGNKEGGKLVDWWEKDESGTNYIPEYHPMFSVFTVGVGNTDYDYTKPASQDMTNDSRHRIIRYAEVLLWYAEAQARADGKPNTLAYRCINDVRERAGLDPLPAGMSGQAFADAALMEHGWEVAGNWCALVTRRADQMRMELLQKTFEDRKRNEPIEVAPGVMVQESVLVPDKATWQGEKTIYAPYPAMDASLNPNLVR
ncbi:RagB/SusD family nutrient uptake outer membrane protein [Parabacteroides sp. APC149_11_2_Y6]